jgi:hypothetical protein
VEKSFSALVLISMSPSTRARPAHQGGGHDDTISVGTLGGTNEDASLP